MESRADQALETSNLAVRLARWLVILLIWDRSAGRFTSIEERDGVIDCFLSVGFEDLFHVRERWVPLECVAEVTVRSHRTKIAA